MIAGEKTGQKPGAMPEKKVAPEAVELKRLEAAAHARRLKHSQGGPSQVPIVGLTKSFVPVGTQGLAIKKTDEEEDDLLDEIGADKHGAEKNPCGDRKPNIDMNILAEKIYERLLFEARIERERMGWELG